MGWGPETMHHTIVPTAPSTGVGAVPGPFEMVVLAARVGSRVRQCFEEGRMERQRRMCVS